MISVAVAIIIIINIALILRITSLLPYAGISLSITKYTYARFTYIAYPTEVASGSPAVFSTILDNLGSVNITETITITVKDSSLNTVATYTDNSATLAPLGMRNYSASWTATSGGTYWVIFSAAYNSTESKTAEENRTFNVTGVTTTTLPGPSPWYPSPVTIPTIIPVINMTLDYTNFLNLTLNESSLIPLYITNNGNTDLHNLSVHVQVDTIQWEVRPNNLTVLPPGTTVIFFISVQIPERAEQHNYTMEFSVVSAELVKTGKVTITVHKVELCTEVERAIRSYASLVDRIDVETTKAASQGRNVTLVLMHLSSARAEFDSSKDLYRKGKCDEARQKLENVKRYLEYAILELAQSIIPTSPIIFYIAVIILVAIIVAVIIVLIKARARIIVKPLFAMLSEDRKKHRERIKELDKAYRKKHVDRSDYEKEREKAEEELDRIENEIMARFGSKKQQSLLEDVKKSYIEGIISKEVYIKSRERLVDKIISEVKR
jgi:ribosomal protein L19